MDYLRADTNRTVPNYVGVGPIPYLGAAYLGQTHEPFTVYGDPNSPQFEVPNLGLKEQRQIDRLNDRVGLRDHLDRLSREVDRLGSMHAFDTFQDQAWPVLTSREAHRAFDINLEDSRTRTSTAATLGDSNV